MPDKKLSQSTFYGHPTAPGHPRSFTDRIGDGELIHQEMFVKKMTFDYYSEASARTIKPFTDPGDQLLEALMGLNGEAGEAIDILKKARYQGHALDATKLVEELGDVMFYINEAALALGVPLEVIAVRNIEKLKARYPGSGFDPERSRNR
jgi:NTP pyrophosphatase (non-canonical NTP hydrolase)